MTITIPSWFTWFVIIGFGVFALAIGGWFFWIYGATKGWWKADI